MDKYLLSTAVICLVWGIVPSVSNNEINSNVALRTITQGTNLFGTDLYKQLAGTETDNLICSTISVSIVLSMLAYGAMGQTKNELYQTLHLPLDDTLSQQGFRSLTDKLNNVTEVDLRLANKIYTALDFKLNTEYIKILEDSFSSTPENINFEETQEASEEINKWCANNTNDRITDLFKPDDLVGARMVLLNAVYFKGNWQKQFNPNETRNTPFYDSDNNEKNVQMMYQNNDYVYGDVPDVSATFIKLPYKSTSDDEAISMFIILPDEGKRISDIENKLDAINFDKLRSYPKRKIDLYLPKFEIRSTLPLNNILQQLGIVAAFSDNANFARITTTEGLEISKILQKAFIQVNEEGSEAAAVTGGGIRTTAIQVPIVFKVDRPFLYFIIYEATNTILFQGHVTDPTLS